MKKWRSQDRHFLKRRLFYYIFQRHGSGIVFCRFQNTDGRFQIATYADHTMSAQKGNGSTCQGLFDSLVDGMSAMLAKGKALDISEDLMEEGILGCLEVLIFQSVSS